MNVIPRSWYIAYRKCKEELSIPLCMEDLLDEPVSEEDIDSIELGILMFEELEEMSNED